MREKKLFSGSIVPLVTPFTKDNQVDLKALAALVEWHIQEGTDAIVCLGTTGESPTLDKDEKLAIIKTCLKVSNKRIPIIVGTGTNNTKESVAMTQTAKDLKADGALVIVPYYNKPTPRGCLEHFRMIAKVGLPVMLYHHPGRTGIRLPIATLVQMQEEKLILAVKDSSGDLQFIKDLKKACDLPCLSGDDNTTLSFLKEGAAGGVCVITNALPREWKEVITLALKGKFMEATLLENRYAKFLEALSLEVNPTPVKYVLSLMGKCHATPRLPLVEPEESTKKRLQESFSAIPEQKKMKALVS
jgi:4-hydroxy-tetrahydrodipicolinate synthase